MKCLDCPLCVSDYCDACGDGDIYCLITGDYAKDEGGAEEQTNSLNKRYCRTVDECRGRKDSYGNGCFKMRYIDNTPTADVVPKSEVERLKAELDDKQFRCDSCDRIMLTSQEHRVCIEQAKADVAREIFEEIELWLAFDGDIRIITAEKFAELKKKHAESENG